MNTTITGDNGRRMGNPLPRWRGFNLLEMFSFERKAGFFVETDLQCMAEWGFDFVRIPMDYRLWADPRDPLAVRDEALAPLDELLRWAGRYGIHVCLNFHRAPGYCVNRNTPELANLWRDAGAQAVFCAHWAAFASRMGVVESARRVRHPRQRPTRCCLRGLPRPCP